MRHGLTAETVIDIFEDPIAYKALQRAIYADYRPRSNFELQLVGRLASLLWRLRRATAIESGILTIQANAHRRRKVTRDSAADREKLKPFYELIPRLVPTAQTESDQEQNSENSNSTLSLGPRGVHTAIASSFIRLSRLDSNVFERLGRYEIRLWRQTVQTILVLNSIGRRATGSLDGEDKEFLLNKTRRRLLWPPFTSVD